VRGLVGAVDWSWLRSSARSSGSRRGNHCGLTGWLHSRQIGKLDKAVVLDVSIPLAPVTEHRTVKPRW
jgi:hypothetical protein